MSIKGFSPTELGERLRLAREAARLTQKDAADAVGVARTTLVAIEQGNRPVRIDELQRLASAYGTNVNALLRREAVHVDLVPRFRKMSSVSDDAAEAASKLLTDLAKAEVELENLLGIQRIANYPPERSLLPGDVTAQAEQDAMELRQRLGLGLQPVQDIVSLLEFEMGVRVYIRPIDTKISGLFAFDEKLGACFLLNANHPRARRNQTAAHESGHLVSTRRQPDVLYYLVPPERTPEEKYANAFARSFLTPRHTVIQKFKELTAGSSQLTRRNIIVLSHFFGVSREAMVRRLEELGQVKQGAWDYIVATGPIREEHASQVLGDAWVGEKEERESAVRANSLRLASLANEAHRRCLLSEGQLSRLLNLDRVEFRAMLDDFEVQGEAGNENPLLLR